MKLIGRNEGSAVDTSLDDVARGLANSTLSRGKALRLMGAVLFGSALASMPSIAWTKPKPAGTCKKDKECPSPGTCKKDKECPSPEDLCCDGVCTNVVFDRNNCGACGNVCKAGEGCCGQSCIPLNTQQNCGCCGCACLNTEQCVDVDPNPDVQEYRCV